MVTSACGVKKVPVRFDSLQGTEKWLPTKHVRDPCTKVKTNNYCLMTTCHHSGGFDSLLIHTTTSGPPYNIEPAHSRGSKA